MLVLNMVAPKMCDFYACPIMGFAKLDFFARFARLLSRSPKRRSRHSAGSRLKGNMQRRNPEGCRLKTVLSPTDLPERKHQIGAAAIDGIQTLLTGRYGRLS